MDGLARPRCGAAGLIAGLVIALIAGAAAPSAYAQGEPQVISGPEIEGTPGVGETLTASGTWSGDEPIVAAYEWRRCDASGPSCTTEPVGTGESYQLSPADAGSRLRVKLSVTNAVGADDETSDPTPVIQPEVPSPLPGPEPEPTPGPTPTPAGARTAAVLDPPPAFPQLLDPFPSVRIRGHLTDAGARVTLLSVRAPEGAGIDVRCAGRSCPRRRVAVASSLSRLRPFERRLRAGTRLTITVTKAPMVGKHTLIVIRRGLAPRRRDRCLLPTSTSPSTCPAA